MRARSYHATVSSHSSAQEKPFEHITDRRSDGWGAPTADGGRNHLPPQANIIAPAPERRRGEAPEQVHTSAHTHGTVAWCLQGKMKHVQSHASTLLLPRSSFNCMSVHLLELTSKMPIVNLPMHKVESLCRYVHRIRICVKLCRRSNIFCLKCRLHG